MKYGNFQKVSTLKRWAFHGAHAVNIRHRVELKVGPVIIAWGIVILGSFYRVGFVIILKS